MGSENVLKWGPGPPHFSLLERLGIEPDHDSLDEFLAADSSIAVGVQAIQEPENDHFKRDAETYVHVCPLRAGSLTKKPVEYRKLDRSHGRVRHGADAAK